MYNIVALVKSCSGGKDFKQHKTIKQEFNKTDILMKWHLHVVLAGGLCPRLEELEINKVQVPKQNHICFCDLFLQVYSNISATQTM